MVRFIELTYFERDTVYPDKSCDTGKTFLLNTDDISTLTQYGDSTKIRFKYSGGFVHVVESYAQIFEKLQHKKKH